MAGSAISFSGVEHRFRKGDEDDWVRVLEPTDIEVGSGEFVAIVGPSGCGKTTLLNMVSGLVVPERGEVLVNGRPPTVGAPQVGYLFARDALVPWRTAAGNVSLALEFRKTPPGRRAQTIDKVLRAMGLGDFADSYPAQLSHGMRQRVAIARTLAPGPDTLLMDEPFSALDAQTRMVIQEQFIQQWERDSITVILVTHDLAEAIALADRLVVMSRRPGRIKAQFRIELPRPRRVTDLHGNPAFHALYEKIWGVFRDEVIEQGTNGHGAAGD
jgi:NitT/TauT family transport system ATP-binding protein